jgi:hypothetical protein
VLPSPFDVGLDRVDDEHRVATLGEWDRVHPGTPADVEEPRRRGRKETGEQLQRPEVLQTRTTVHEEPRLLESELVVRGDVRIHQAIVTANPPPNNEIPRGSTTACLESGSRRAR